MPTIETMNLPDELYAQVEKLARVRGKSVAEVAASLIARAVANDDADAQKLLAEIRAERDELAKRGVFTTDDFLRSAREQGRP